MNSKQAFLIGFRSIIINKINANYTYRNIGLQNFNW